MKCSPGTTLLALSAASVLACQPAAPQFSAQDEAAVRGMFDASLKNLQAGDWTAWAAGFSDDAILQPPNAPTVKGRTALEAWGHTFPAIESVTWPNVQVHGEGNLAYGTSDWTLKLKDLPEDHGKQLAVLHRTPDGKWEVVAVSFSSDLPMPAPAPATRKK